MSHFSLRIEQPLLGLRLLEDHIFKPALHVVQPAQGQGRHGRSDQRVSLTLEPTVIHAQRADVLDDQLQQLEQCGLDFKLLLSGKRDPVAEVGQHQFHCADV